MTYAKFKNIINLLILTVTLFACGNRPKDFKYVTDKIEAYKKQNNNYPTSLKQIDAVAKRRQTTETRNLKASYRVEDNFNKTKSHFNSKRVSPEGHTLASRKDQSDA